MLNFSKHLCTKCVSPHSAESITFDNEGVCSVCHQIDFKKEKINWKERANEFDKLLSNHKNKYDYDCIVPFSGGKDSTYTLWYLTRVKKLKCLVVSFDHGFYRPQHIENRRKTLHILGQDYLQFSPNFKLVRSLMLSQIP